MNTESLSNEQKRNYEHWLTVSWDMTFPNNEHLEQKQQLLKMKTQDTLNWIDYEDIEQAKREKTVRVMKDGYQEQSYNYIKVNCDTDTTNTDVTDKLRDHNETLRDTYLKLNKTQTRIYFQSPCEVEVPEPLRCLYDIGIIHQGTLEKGQIVVETKFDGSKTTDELVKSTGATEQRNIDRADWFEAQYKFQRFENERYFVDQFCRAVFVSVERGKFSNIPTRICLPVMNESMLAVFELTCIACGGGHRGGPWWAYRKYNKQWFNCDSGNIRRADEKIPEQVNMPRLLLYSRIHPDLQDKLNFVRHRPLSAKENELKEEAFDEVSDYDKTLKTIVFKHSLLGKDFSKLRDKKWLSDNIINMWVQLLLERSRHLQLKLDNQNDSFMTSYFIRSLKKEKYVKMAHRVITRCNHQVSSVNEIDRIFVPFHTGNHWYLIIIFVKDRAIKCFDSLRTNTTEKSEPINKLLKPWLKATLDDDFEITFVTKMPQQENGYDCGVFLCAALDYASALPASETEDDTATSIKFQQKDMPHFRERMACRLMQGERSLVDEGRDAGILQF